MPELNPAQREGVRQAVITMIEKVELNGYHSSWLAPDSPSSRGEVEVDQLTWEAGLGATTEELEKPVFLKSISDMRKRMKDAWNLDIPLFTHYKFAEPF